jgi:hypothetical protein
MRDRSVATSSRSSRQQTSGWAFWFQGICAVIVRPGLWSTAVRQWGRMMPRRWWARLPFLPVPDRGYIRFRMETAYGVSEPNARRADDLVAYLRWCRDTERSRRRHAA